MKKLSKYLLWAFLPPYLWAVSSQNHAGASRPRRWFGATLWSRSLLAVCPVLLWEQSWVQCVRWCEKYAAATNHFVTPAMQRYNAEDENWYQTRDRLATLQNPPSGLTLVLHGEWTKQTENKEDANMDSILDFFRAASPWVAMELLLAIFLSGVQWRKRKVKNKMAIMEQKACVLVCVSALHSAGRYGMIPE